ncbi:MAG: 16S rRNA (cytosine(1402)-N(4))-methyltransferase RsmH [Clostridia bacterium]|nr:16S rRNA (cytosine(1402)-N(4))-methyltransferase RsmH [Clostridia bacterium]
MTATTYHIPIMTQEVLDCLDVCRGGIFVDCTLGGGGHSEAILKSCERIRLIGIDRDSEAIAEAQRRLKPYSERFSAIHGNFFDLRELLLYRGIDAVDGILIDLGVSSHQLDATERGFSYKAEAPLDMRMDRSAPLTAYEVVNRWDEERLCDIFFRYGEERFSRRIAQRIVETRGKKPIETTVELAEIIRGAIPAKFRHSEAQHPARRCFQAIRIAVNGELDGLQAAIESCCNLLNKGGRLAVLTFHSLEDRIVKTLFRRLENPCTCPPSAPVCICGKKPTARVLTKKPITANELEREQNSRSTSAKLRAIERL